MKARVLWVISVVRRARRLGRSPGVGVGDVECLVTRGSGVARSETENVAYILFLGKALFCYVH